jgi:hypothetical protein
MVELFQKQPDNSLKGPINWFLFLGWVDEPGGTPIYQPVSFAASKGNPYTPQTPLAPNLTAVITSRTTATVSWTPPQSFTGPAIQFWYVEMRTSTDSGTTYGAWTPITGSPFGDETLTKDLVGLAVGTPEVRFQFQARGENADGLGDYSDPYTVFWGGVVTNPPNPPRSLVVTNVTAHEALLSWTPSLGAATDGATKQGVWSGNVNLNIDIDPNANSFRWDTLAAGTSYPNTNIRRFNAGGWSGGTNWVDFTTDRSTRVTVDDPVMGQSVPSDQNVYRTQIDAIRAYNTGDVNSFFNTYSPRVIAYTDDPFSNGASGQVTMAYVDHVKTMLDNFNTSAARLDCEVHVAYGNEIDRNWTSGNLSAAFINVYAGLRDLIWGTTGGVRDYPNASVWVDMTANNIRGFGAGPRFRAISQYLDGMACSMYPAGRTIQASNPLIEYDPASYPSGSLWNGNSRNAYSYYCDPVFAALSDWRQNGGAGNGALRSQLNQFATWEIGIPIHHSLDRGALSALVRTGANATDITQRPRYLVGGARTSGPANMQYNMKGFLPYIQDKCATEDVSMREQLYWNQWSNTVNDDSPGTSIPNPWEADHNKTDPDSQDAWYSWFPGFRLADI